MHCQENHSGHFALNFVNKISFLLKFNKHTFLFWPNTSFSSFSPVRILPMSIFFPCRIAGERTPPPRLLSSGELFISGASTATASRGSLRLAHTQYNTETKQPRGFIDIAQFCQTILIKDVRYSQKKTSFNQPRKLF